MSGQPSMGRIVIFHSSLGDRPAIIIANHGQVGHELRVFWTNNDYAEFGASGQVANEVATEGNHVGGWSWPAKTPTEAAIPDVVVPSGTY